MCRRSVCLCLFAVCVQLCAAAPLREQIQGKLVIRKLISRGIDAPCENSVIQYAQRHISDVLQKAVLSPQSSYRLRIVRYGASVDIPDV